MMQGRLKFSRTRKVWESPVREEHVISEITALLWFQARIPVFRIRERIPDIIRGKKRWRGGASTVGIPDLIGWIPFDPKRGIDEKLAQRPTPLYIECKRPGGVHRPAQIRFIEDAASAGCAAFFAASWDDVINEMRKVGIKLTEAK